METLNSYLPTLLVFLGLAMLAIEVGVLGFSIMILFFIGLGCLATGLLMFAGIVPQTLAGALLGSGILSLLSAVGLWQPLQRMQNSSENKPVTSDLIGAEFVLESDLNGDSQSEVKFSGISWKVVSESDIPKGTTVQVTGTAVGKLTVSPKG